MVHWEITQEVKELPELRKPVLVEGLPGIGNVGKIAADFLIEELKAEHLLSFFSYRFPNSVFVNEKNLVEMPKLEMYYKKYGPRSTKKDVLILTGDIQPIDEESCYTFCEEILKIARKLNCVEVITTGGIGLEGVPDNPRVFCTSNDLKLYRSYTKKGMGVHKGIFGVVGPIVGVSGLLLGLGMRRKVKAVSLLADTFGHPMYLGIKGATEIVRVLEKRFKWNVSLSKMNREVIEVEAELMKKTKEWAAEMTSGAQPGAKPKSHEVRYIG